MVKRLYQEWKGHNTFFLGGRMIFGPDIRLLVVAFILIAVPVAIFCIFVVRDLIHRFHHHGGIAILVATVVYTFYILVLLLLTSGSDPGIVPRNAHPPEFEEDFDSTVSTSEWSGIQTPQTHVPRTKDVMVNGVTVKVKYCETCMLYRPPRSSHCSICNNCVERFDHHCPWIGQCIGRRNYHFFFFFIASASLLCIFLFTMSAFYIKFLMDGKSHTVWKAIKKSPISAILMIYTFVAFWFVGGLTFFHIYLISTNQTTYENFRYRYEKIKNPYYKGILNSFREVFCRTIPPSNFNFRAKLEDSLTSENDFEGNEDFNYLTKPVSDIEIRVKSWSPIAGNVKELQHQPSPPEKPGKQKEGKVEDATHTLDCTSLKAVDVSAGAHSRSSSCGGKSGSSDIFTDSLALVVGIDGETSQMKGGSTPPNNM